MINVPTVIWDKVSVKYNAERNEKPVTHGLIHRAWKQHVMGKLWIAYDLSFFYTFKIPISINFKYNFLPVVSPEVL